MIKVFIGVCTVCQEQGDESEKPLVKKKFCDYHNKIRLHKESQERKKQRSEVKKVTGGVTIEEAVLMANKTNIGQWFKDQSRQAPNNCEECGCSIRHLIGSTVIIAHILPKAKNKFPEVATHPLNRLFLCDLCHNRFDKRDNAYRITMNCIPVMKERLRAFYPLLSESQQMRALKVVPFEQEELL